MDEPVLVPIQLRAARETFSSWDGFLAFGGGSGLLPRAPGTWGTLVAVPLLYPLQALSGSAFLVVLAALFALGVLVCNRVGRRLGVDEYGGIVWDEMVGYWLAMAFAPPGWLWMLAGFGLFRLFDIIKPWPINALEVRVTGGLGVMLDDVLAAVYAMVVLAGAEHYLLG
jgi:phosphatidylglycerophosphatase A